MREMTSRDVEAITDPGTDAKCLVGQCHEVMPRSDARKHAERHGYPTGGMYTLVMRGPAVRA